MRVTLHAPAISCDHCIETIRQVVAGADGATFVSGDPEARSFVVDLSTGAALDRLGEALAEAGYPLGEPALAAPTRERPDPATWEPSFRVTRTGAGADVNYDCYCGCDAGFALDRAQADQSPESCCCGNRIVVGHDALHRLTRHLEDPTGYRLVTQQITMPWGQPVDVALAVPAAPAEHGSGVH